MLSYFGSEMINATLVTVAAGSYGATTGLWTPGAQTTATIKVIAPQPVTPEEKQMLPGGELDRNYVKTWTTSPITSWGSADPDKLTIGGKTYKIMSIDNRSILGNFYKLILREEKTNE